MIGLRSAAVPLPDSDMRASHLLQTGRGHATHTHMHVWVRASEESSQMPSVTQISISFSPLNAYSACAPHHLNTLKFPHSCGILFVWLALSIACKQRSLLLGIWQILLPKTTIILSVHTFPGNHTHDIGIQTRIPIDLNT